MAFNPENVSIKNKSYFKYDSDTKRFFCLDENSNDIGYYTHLQILKYLASVFDTYGQFLKDVELPDTCIYLIKSQIVRIEFGDFELISIESSNFVKDIKCIIQLNRNLHEFETKYLEEELEKIGDKRIRTKVDNILKKFIYYFLNQSLTIISLFCDKMKDNLDDKLKESIRKYTVSSVYRLTQFTQKQVNMLMDQIHKLGDNMNDLSDSRNTLGTKLENLYDKINEQNKLLKDMKQSREYTNKQTEPLQKPTHFQHHTSQIKQPEKTPEKTQHKQEEQPHQEYIEPLSIQKSENEIFGHNEQQNIGSTQIQQIAGYNNDYEKSEKQQSNLNNFKESNIKSEKQFEDSVKSFPVKSLTRLPIKKEHHSEINNSKLEDKKITENYENIFDEDIVY